MVIFCGQAPDRKVIADVRFCKGTAERKWEGNNTKHCLYSVSERFVGQVQSA